MAMTAEILDYWFGKSDSDPQVFVEKGKLWFGKDEQVDREIENRFGSLIEIVAERGLLAGEQSEEKRYLASILVVDQFTRNVFRNDPRAFASDPVALKLAFDALDAGHDRRLRPIERVFLYLPLEHSEDLSLQNRSVALFEALLADLPEEWKPAFSGTLDYAIRHQQIIARFGRFPHRNRILGRESTPEEIEFLKQPNSSF